MLESDTCDPNSFTYSNVLCLSNNNHFIVDQQFGRFSQFVETQADAIRLELRRFYAPMMCHLYIELLKAREPKAAADLFRKYMHLLSPVSDIKIHRSGNTDGICSSAQVTANGLPNDLISNIRCTRDPVDDHEADYFAKLIHTLACISSLDALEHEPEAVRFRSSKYELHTTQAAVDALTTYLEKRGHVLILQVINTWLHVHIVDNEVRQWTEDQLFAGQHDDEELANDCRNSEVIMPRAAIKRSASVANKSSPNENSAGNVLDEQELRNLQRQENVRNCLQTMREVRGELLKTQMEFPHFFKLADKGRGLTSAHLDVNECHIAAGFNNSVVGLWPVNQQMRSGKQFHRRQIDIECPWDMNNCNIWNGNVESRKEDDVIECDIREDARMLPKEEQQRRQKFLDGKYEDNSYNDFGAIQMRGHGLGVTDVRFSAHYPLLYSTSKDHTWRSWRADSYSCALIYRGHRYPVWCLDESPIGMYVATGSHDLSARLWAIERDYPLITYAGHTQDVECVAFHPNGNYLATGSADMSVRLWCVSSGRLVRVFHDCKQPVAAIAFSPDGKFLAAGGDEPKVRIYDLAAGAQLSELKDHSASVTSIAWSSCGREVASVCRDGSLRLWDVKKLTPLVINENSTSTTSASVHRLMAMSSSCQSLVRVLYSRSETICCLGL